MRIRSVTVVRGDRFASLDFTNRPVTADRTRVVTLGLECFFRAMAYGYPIGEPLPTTIVRWSVP